MLGLGLPQQAGHEPAVAATLKGCCGNDAARNIQQTEKGASPCLLLAPCRLAAVFPAPSLAETKSIAAESREGPSYGKIGEVVWDLERWYKSNSKTNLFSVTKKFPLPLYVTVVNIILLVSLEP